MKVCADDPTRACVTTSDCAAIVACVSNPKHVAHGATTCPTVAADCANPEDDRFLKIKNFASPVGHCTNPTWSDPDTCIDCGLCIDECPVQAIFPEEDLPEEWKKYLKINEDWYKEPGA